MKITNDLNQVLPVLLTTCEVLTKVINFSTVNTSSPQSSANINNKFTSCARHCLHTGGTAVNKTTKITIEVGRLQKWGERGERRVRRAR